MERCEGMNPTQEKRPENRAATTGQDESRQRENTTGAVAPQYEIDWQLVDAPPAMRRESEAARVLRILDEIETDRRAG
jgi:hypothetical protein